MMVCSFCGKSEDKVRRILYGGLGEESVICNECVLASYNMLVESGDIKPGRAPSAVSDSKSEFISNGSELMKPEEIKETVYHCAPPRRRTRRTFRTISPPTASAIFIRAQGLICGRGS